MSIKPNYKKVKEIVFTNTKTNIRRNEIPLFYDTSVDISYSSIRLINEEDIKKLKKLSINPKAPNTTDNFYIKDIDGINEIELTQEDIDTQKNFKQDIKDKQEGGKQKRLNILCIIDDILGEIEDMYEHYHTNYKLAYSQNHPIIEDIKKNNSYTYTISNMIDYFYFSPSEESKYKTSILDLKKIYNEIVKLFLSTPSLINYLVQDKDISLILDKDKKKVAQSYFKQIQFLKKDFFDKEFKDEEKEKSLNESYYSEVTFRTSKDSFNTTYVYLTPDIKKTNQRYIRDMSKNHQIALEFNTNNDDYTHVRTNASHVLAHVLFSLLYSNEFEEDLKALSTYSKINDLRNKFLLKLRSIKPKPNINSSSINNMQELISKQEVYNDIANNKDEFLKQYDNLDYIKSIKSFEQTGDKVSFKSKHMYHEETRYFKSSIKKPKDIIQDIKSKLQDAKLKEILNIYKNIKDTNAFDYVISALNIIYLLSAPRTKLDEETNINSFFNEDLNHIYDFVVDATEKRIKLSDIQKDILNTEYKISEVYALMQIKLILNDIVFSNSKKKAIKFIKKFEVSLKDKTNEETKTHKNYIYINDETQNITSKKRAIYEALKNMQGVTSSLDEILEEFAKGETKKYNISKTLASHISTGLKTYSSLIAIVSISDYLFFDDKQKNIKSHIGFIDDLTNVSASLALLISKYPSTPFKTLELFSKNISVSKISQSSKKLLSFMQNKVLVKVSVITIIITTAYDTVNLYQRKDYDALALTLSIAGIGLSLILCAPLIPALISGAIIGIIGGLILNDIKDSDLDIYLKKSLLYRTVDFSFWKQVRKISQDKKFQAPYVFEITNINKDLKAIAFDGFNKSKDLTSFIGKNYKGNEEYFNTALKNELSFFKSALFGYKLELLKATRKVKKLKNKYDLDIVLNERTFIRIPSTIYSDKQSKFIFVENGKYTLIDKDSAILPENNYYIFDLYKQNFSHLEELKSLHHKQRSIIVLSSQIQLKYDFIYEYKDINYLFALNFKQTSFTKRDDYELNRLLKILSKQEAK